MNMLQESTFLFFAFQLAIQAEPGSADLWHQGSPESQCFSAAKLEALRTGLGAQDTRGFLVVRNDTIACEWHAPGRDRNTKPWLKCEFAD